MGAPGEVVRPARFVPCERCLTMPDLPPLIRFAVGPPLNRRGFLIGLSATSLIGAVSISGIALVMPSSTLASKTNSTLVTQHTTLSAVRLPAR